MTTLRETTDMMLTATRNTKTSRCWAEKGPSDLAPLVHIIDTEDRAYIAIIPDRDYIAVAVKAMVPDGELAFVGFCADANMKQMPLDSPDVNLQRGELLHRFGLGDMSIVEVLVVTVIDIKTGEIASAMQTYRYDDNGLPVYDEPDSVSLTVTEGQVAENLRAR